MSFRECDKSMVESRVWGKPPAVLVQFKNGFHAEKWEAQASWICVLRCLAERHGPGAGGQARAREVLIDPFRMISASGRHVELWRIDAARTP